MHGLSRFTALIFCLLNLLPSLGSAEERLHVGRFQSRAIWRSAEATNEIIRKDTDEKARPAIILIPGSGPNGPEEMMDPEETADGIEHSLFAEISAPLNRAGFHTLALGKPGIEFFQGWDRDKWFYDAKMYGQTRWQDLMTNVMDAIRLLRERPDVDKNRIYLLGHSEGTVVAVDVAARDRRLAGIVLLGFSGEDMATTIDWQLYRRTIDTFVKTDIDANRDGFVSRAEAAAWKEFSWDWKPGQEKISFAEIEAVRRASPERAKIVASIRESALHKTTFQRGPLYPKAAGLRMKVIAMTGSLDVQTRPEEARRLAEACRQRRKANCLVRIIPGLGHGFSPPKGPRSHPLLDMTLGPIHPNFQNVLYQLGLHL